MTAIEWLESRISVLIPEDIGSQLMFKSNIKKAKAVETVESMRAEKLETLAKLLAKIWFHCDWKWESPNERVMQMLMQELGYYPFKDEDEMIRQTQVDDNLYKQAAKEIPGWKAVSADGPTPMLERLKEHIDSITPEQFVKEFDEVQEWFECEVEDCKHCAEDIAQMQDDETFKVWECCGMEECVCDDDGLTDDEWLIKELKKERVEISDEEIEKWVASTPYYGHCTPEYKEGLEDGAKWYKEQIKSKQ